jgi:hypothetical protein
MKDVFLLLIMLVGTIPMNLFSYIDPGSGSALISGILGFFAAIIYTIEKYIYKIKSFFTKNFS